MKLHRIAIAAVLTTTLAGLAVAPAVSAQQFNQRPGVTEPGQRPPMERGMRRGGEQSHAMQRGQQQGSKGEMRGDRGNARMMPMHRMRGGLFNFTRTPQMLEMALVRIAYAADLDEHQQELLSNLRSDLLAAHSAFVDATADLRPDREARREAGERMNMTDMLSNTIAMQQAQTEALEAIQPAFEEFMSSLTDEQREALQPRRWHRRDAPGAADQRTAPPADTDTPTPTDDLDSANDEDAEKMLTVG